jgi:superfamily I DNA/RNA helicase/mRNA-degrading endonuclease RelE of RelBE toxin-antitoxin system
MEFRIADTFTDSLARLTGEEQKAVKTTAFDLQMNPANPGMSFHKLDKARDKNFCSVRVSKDIRLIVHKSEASILLCYVNHHDKAYDWAERRKLEVHPKTGAAQLVEIRETVHEIILPVYIQSEIPLADKPKLFADVSDERLLEYGVPPEWIKDVKEANEDNLLILTDHLPAEAGEALLEIATGGKPQIKQPVQIGEDPFAHPDAQRRFRVMNNVEELQLALEFPWDKWAVFLHPEQKEIVEGDYSGPVRVSGSAGTGKTIVALHRAVFLAKSNPNSRILLTTYSRILSNALSVRLRKLISSEPHFAERIDMYAINDIGLRLYKSNIEKPNLVTTEELKSIIKEVSDQIVNQKFSQAFLLAEFDQVIDACQLNTWNEYKDVKRLGRKTRLPEQQRELLWNIFSSVNDKLKASNLTTYASLFTQLAHHIDQTNKQPYDYAIIDEAQDMSVYHLRFLSALGKDKPNSLFFAGDLGQRIFQQPFSWKSLGVDIRGRSKTLHVNYRTSHQIRERADLLLDPELTDADGNMESRSKTISVFNGPLPEIRIFNSAEEESNYIAEWIRTLKKEGFALHEIGIFVRSDNEIGRAQKAAIVADVQHVVLDENMETLSNKLVISTMHLAKGLEFKAVAVMACDDEIIPSQERIEAITDNADLEDVYNTERYLLYVACTRARDQLVVTSVNPSSEFLEDIGNK